MKPTNSIQAPMQTKLVASVTAAPTGTFVTASNSLNILDGQIGILEADLDSANYGDFSATPTGKFVKLVQGTPSSANTTNVDPWGVSDPSHVETNRIYKDFVRSATKTNFTSGQFSMTSFVPDNTFVANEPYGLIVELDGRRQEKEFGINTDQPSAVAVMPSVLPTSSVDYALQTIAFKLNQTSSALNGVKRFVVLGVNVAGGSGTAISTLTNNGAGIDFMVQDGVTYTVPSTTEMVRGLASMIDSSTLTAASTIEVISSVTPGSAATIDALLIVGLDAPMAAYEDDVMQVRTDVTVNPKDGFEETGTLVKVYHQEPENTGRKLTIENRHRAQLDIHTKQLTPMGEYFSEGYTYIDPKKNYGTYIVDFYDTERTIDHQYAYEKQFTVLWEQTEPTTLSVDGVAAGTTAVLTFTPTETEPAVIAQFDTWIA